MELRESIETESGFVMELLDLRDTTIELYEKMLEHYAKALLDARKEANKLQKENRALRAALQLPIEGYSYRNQKSPSSRDIDYSSTIGKWW